MTVNYGDCERAWLSRWTTRLHRPGIRAAQMQQRAPTMRIKFRELTTGRQVERSFSGYDVGFKLADVERRTAQYIYDDDSLYYFMDTDTYDQFPLSADQIADGLQFLVEQIEVDLVLYRDNPVCYRAAYHRKSGGSRDGARRARRHRSGRHQTRNAPNRP